MSAVFVVPLSLVPTVIETCHVAVGLTTGVSPKLNLIISSSVCEPSAITAFGNFKFVL